MFKDARTNIVFCAQDILKNQATHIIDERNLKAVLNIIAS